MPHPYKIVFFDRDGVINKRQADHRYITSVHEFIFNNNIFEVFKYFAKKNYKFIIITNQRAISRGLLTEEKLHKIHDYMLSELKKNHIEILDIFFCPHGYDECNCRKPMPGMLESAMKKYNIDLENSILISDEMDDIRMGENFKIGRNLLIKRDSPADILRVTI